MFVSRLIMLYLILIFIAMPPSKLLGYCKGDGLNITMILFLDIGDCNVENIEPNRAKIYIQLMQLSDFDKTAAI